MLKKGDKACDFTLQGQDGKYYSLHDFTGRRVVLYFYSKDYTSGCSREAEGFRDVYEELLQEDTVVIGISKDSVSSHAGFAAKYSLPFILLSDPDRETAGAYGVIKEKKSGDSVTYAVIRSTFVIDGSGVIEKVYDKVSPQMHACNVLSDIREAGDNV